MLILLATFTSLRFGELAALTRRRVDLDAGLITVTEAANKLNDGTRIVDQPKTHAGRRVVGVSPLLIGDLRAHLEDCSMRGRDGLVFTGPLGAPLGHGSWSKNWRRTVDRLDSAHLHFHDLRHTGNTLAASTGASTKELMNRMGHGTTSTPRWNVNSSSQRSSARWWRWPRQ